MNTTSASTVALPPRHRTRVRRIIGALALALALALSNTSAYALPLSNGDRLKLTIPEGAEFNGRYEIDTDGQIQMPHLGAVPVAGLEPDQAAARIAEALVRKGLFRPEFAKVSLQVLAWAPIEVSVGGAVYLPGRQLINSQQRIESDRSIENDLPGDASPERYLTNAIALSGGVEPDADVAHVRVLRGGLEKTYDLSGLISGEPVAEIPLVAGDRVYVPRTKTFDVSLVRPSRITPGTVKVYLSNLTVPAKNNSAAAIENNRQDAVGFPYGSRFSQAVVAANCVGGTQATNSDRVAVLVHTDRVSGKTRALQRPIEAILRDSSDENNPLLLPGDGVACYDSTVTNVRDIFSTIGDILFPFNLLFGPNRIFGLSR
jgi:polysaccharide export outer membrane protein